MYYDFSYGLDFDPEYSLPIGVIQIKNDADSMIFWQSFKLIDTETSSGIVSVKRNNKIDTRHIPDSIFHINSYFWNNNNGRVTIRNLNANLYQLSDCH